VERTLGWTVESVRHPPKSAPEEVMMRWVREWTKEGIELDPKKLLPRRVPGHSCQGGGLWSAPSLVAFSEQEDEQALRAAGRDQRDAGLRGYDAVDGEGICSCVEFQDSLWKEYSPKSTPCSASSDPDVAQVYYLCV
jgi:hypothetical protein